MADEDAAGDEEILTSAQPAGEPPAKPSLQARLRSSRGRSGRGARSSAGSEPELGGRRLTRRKVLAGVGVTAGLAGAAAAAGGAVYAGWLPGRQRLVKAIEGCGQAGSPPPVSPGAVTVTSFSSAARHREVEMVVAFPPGYEPRSTSGDDAGDGGTPPLPLCLVLHGRGDRARAVADALAGPTYLAAATAAGVAPFALVAVDGGETYWHRRAGGDDPEKMLLDELLPRLATEGIRTDRFAAIGWSMGGYGALLLAQRHPERIVAVAASSPAVWRSPEQSAAGAFDSAADFEAHRVLGAGPAPGVTYRIDCGNADPFSPVAKDLASELAAAETGFLVGCHDFGFWRRQLPAQLAFVGHALSR
ncbi:alpha/beta hydrolase [Frankia nepalensis]|uniref:alpha/beta hydrolase n=1 Tax=Frankia nepalensis TaxID=1836974 RepID=UPI00288B06C4|nr:alpha/beta fold hydrolase [Frankia nepalensis]